jgi:hypothetical protein
MGDGMLFSRRCPMFFDIHSITDNDDLIRNVNDNAWVKYILARKVTFIKLLVFYFFFITTFFMMIAYAGCYVFLGQPLANPLLGDYSFHVARASNVWSNLFNNGSYYAPLFHMILGMFVDKDMGIAALVPLIIYLFIPYAVYKLAKEYHQSTEKAIVSALLYFFAYNSMFYVFTSTFAQALNAIFLCATAMAGIMLIRRDKNALFYLIYFGVLGLFSHTGLGLMCLLIVIISLWLADRKVLFMCSLILIVMSFFQIPFLFERVLTAISNVVSNILHQTLQNIVVKLVLFLNPFVLYYGIKGLKLEQREDILLLFCIFAPLLVVFADTQLRTLLTFIMFLAVLAGGKLYEYFENNEDMKALKVLGASFIMWLLLTLSHIGMLYIYIYSETHNIVEVIFNAI